MIRESRLELSICLRSSKLSYPIKKHGGRIDASHSMKSKFSMENVNKSAMITTIQSRMTMRRV
jgi:hypothetical protein